MLTSRRYRCNPPRLGRDRNYRTGHPRISCHPGMEIRQFLRTFFWALYCHTRSFLWADSRLGSLSPFWRVPRPDLDRFANLARLYRFHIYGFHIAIRMPRGINADHIQLPGTFHNEESFQKGEIHANPVDRAEITGDVEAIYAYRTIRLENGFLEWRDRKGARLGAEFCRKRYLCSDGNLLIGGIMYIDSRAISASRQRAILVRLQ